jgi:hypothetical protein
MKKLFDWFFVFILTLWRRSLESRIDPRSFDPKISQKLDALISLLEE